MAQKLEGLIKNLTLENKKCMNKLIILCVATQLLNSCNGKEKSSDEIVSLNYVQDSLFNNDSLRSTLQEKIINSGDTNAYDELSSIYISFPKEFLYFSIIMANDYKYPKAYYDVYWNLKTEGKNDSGVNKLANYYLIKACELNYDPAKKHAISIYGDSSAIPSSNDFR